MPRNHQRSPQNKPSTGNRGVSSVISVIIISSVLLIILIIASFVSTNILETQITNTEFEQAKTNMLVLDDVIQDVSLRYGSGGYVQFNQRTGGIGISQTTDTIRILGPSQQSSYTLSLKPNAPGYNQNWTIYGGSPTRWEATQDANNNTGVQITYDATYNTKKETENLSDASQIGAINSVTAYVTAQISGGGSQDENMRILWRTSNTDYESGDITVTRNLYSTYSQNRPVNPKTNAAWTWLEVNSLQIGSRATSLQSGETVKVSELWVVVNYTTAQQNIIYEASNLVSLVYRGGTQATAAETILKGKSDYPQIGFVNMTQALGYLRVEQDNGVKIKLDYNRIRVNELETLIVKNETGYDEHVNFVQITILQLRRGNTGGSGTVNLKAQNIGVQTVSHVFNSPVVTIQVQGVRNDTRILNHLDPEASKTVLMITEVIVQVSTA